MNQQHGLAGGAEPWVPAAGAVREGEAQGAGKTGGGGGAPDKAGCLVTVEFQTYSA